MNVAATLLQCRLVEAARAVYYRTGDWPTAIELACEADVPFPVAWEQLRILARLGIVEWTRTVRVVRQPDGVVFAIEAAS